MYFSPKTSADGLVFHYDTGNTVRSYLGEPTTNLWGIQSGTNVNNKSDWSMPYAYNGAITNSVYSSGTWNGNRIWEVLHTAGTSGYAGYESWRECVDQPTAGSGTYGTTRRVAMKICILEGSITDLALHSGGGNGGHNGGAWTAIPTSQVPKDCPVKTGWYQFLEDGSWNSNSVGHCIGLGFISYNRVKLLIAEPMYYPSSKLLPFTGYQRGATQGLKDLTAANTINLSNVSFDANAQMTFDGTNDTVSIPSNSSNNIAGDITMELVLNRTAGYSAAVMHKEQQYTLYVYSSGNITYADSSIWSYSTFGAYGNLTAGTYHHLVATKTGGVVKIYLDGTVIINKSFGSAITQTNNTLHVGSYDGSSNYFGGEIPVAKVYNRALTADEVTRNFNAIKSRFNIG